MPEPAVLALDAVEWPTSGPIAAELWRRLYERLDRLEAEQARLIVALRAGAIGQWGNDGR